MNSRQKGFFLVALSVLFMSFESPIISKTTISDFNFVFYYGFFIFLSTLAVLVITKTSPKEYFKNPKALVLAACCMSASNIFFIIAVKLTGIATTVLILATSPIICALTSFLIEKKTTPKALFASAIAVFIGIFIILNDSQKELNAFGVIFAFLCVFTMALLFITFANLKDVNRYAQINLAGVFMFVIASFFCDFKVDLTSLLLVFLMGMFISPLARVFLAYGSVYLLTAEVGLLFILESILAPVWGYLFLGEVITQNTLIGGAIVLLSVVFYTISYKK
ncbi:DMT family transporter [Campylobacter geochelonis]|uniref:DMT family transporter n=1 Tax=Campylobacter geochelonis TaxID=1780362 RepID=UPI000770B2F9|nr:DMT family transporter [Campylobacter geochelonis]CZE50005.1 Predicted permease%2C DMT superfamily [Campylobacter geochelonis]